MKKRIGYDITILENSQWTGVEKFCFHLLTKYWKYDEDNHHILFGRVKPSYIDSITVQNLEIIIRKNKSTKLWRYTVLPIEVIKAKCDIFISPILSSPIIPNIPVLTYIHECQWFHRTNEKFSFKHLISFYLASLFSKEFLTNSKSTYSDIRKNLILKKKSR